MGTGVLLDGLWRASSTGQTESVRSPFSGQTIADVALASLEDADRVLDSAKETLKSVILIGEDFFGEPYFASSMSSKGDMLLLLERFKQRILADEE